ncbi:hypothetical protein ILFOPFJJ_01674 [Ensifer psoraleae]|nr:hypothetical protein [Sinorhizobium psoraleae]
MAVPMRGEAVAGITSIRHDFRVACVTGGFWRLHRFAAQPDTTRLDDSTGKWRGSTEDEK